jgi:tRNA (guanine-N7-)-methyltransferase
VRRSTRLPLEALSPYLLEIARRTADPPAALNWTAVFGNSRAVEIEVGSGKGLFLLTSALARPAVNFLGIEIVRKYQLFCATRMAKRNLTNVRMSCADARELLQQHISPGSVQAVHVYFPDPWWKKRHHKRRVFTADFVASVARVLRPDGRLLVATDVEVYFQAMRGLVSARTDMRIVPLEELSSQAGGPNCQTNFERKAQIQAKPIYRFQAVRQP